MHRIIRGIEVENKFCRRRRKRGDETLNDYVMNRARYIPVSTMFQTTQGRTGGARRHFAQRGLQGQIMAQTVVIIEILIPLHQRINSLPEQFIYAVLYPSRVTWVRQYRRHS